MKKQRPGILSCPILTSVSRGKLENWKMEFDLRLTTPPSILLFVFQAPGKISLNLYRLPRLLRLISNRNINVKNTQSKFLEISEAFILNIPSINSVTNQQCTRINYLVLICNTYGTLEEQISYLTLEI